MHAMLPRNFSNPIRSPNTDSAAGERTPHKTFPQLFRPSIAFCKLLESLTQKIRPHFATEELGVRSRKEFLQKNAIAKIFSETNIPLVPVDIDENARGYLAYTELTNIYPFHLTFATRHIWFAARSRS